MLGAIEDYGQHFMPRIKLCIVPSEVHKVELIQKLQHKYAPWYSINCGLHFFTGTVSRNTKFPPIPDQTFAC